MPQVGDLVLNRPPVHFQLGFTGTTVGKAASATGLLVEALASARLQAGQPVLQLGNLHLEFGFLGLGPGGKDF